MNDELAKVDALLVAPAPEFHDRTRSAKKRIYSIANELYRIFRLDFNINLINIPSHPNSLLRYEMQSLCL